MMKKTALESATISTDTISNVVNTVALMTRTTFLLTIKSLLFSLCTAQQNCGEQCSISDICFQSNRNVLTCQSAHDCCEWRVGDCHPKANTVNSNCHLDLQVSCPCTLTCPLMVRAGGAGPCHDKCRSNGDCARDQVDGMRHELCCRNECGGHECATGVVSNLVCPQDSPLFDGSGDGNIPYQSLPPCQEECSTTDDCRNGQICCLFVTGQDESNNNNDDISTLSQAVTCTRKCVYGIPPFNR